MSVTDARPRIACLACVGMQGSNVRRGRGTQHDIRYLGLARQLGKLRPGQPLSQFARSATLASSSDGARPVSCITPGPACTPLIAQNQDKCGCVLVRSQ